MMRLQEQITDWGNLWLAYQKAGRGKRGRPTTAAFELFLADNLLALQVGTWRCKPIAQETITASTYMNPSNA